MPLTWTDAPACPASTPLARPPERRKGEPSGIQLLLEALVFAAAAGKDAAARSPATGAATHGLATATAGGACWTSSSRRRKRAGQDAAGQDAVAAQGDSLSG